MSTKQENRIIDRITREREKDPRANFAYLFRARKVNPHTIKMFEAFYDANRARSANATRVTR